MSPALQERLNWVSPEQAAVYEAVEQAYGPPENSRAILHLFEVEGAAPVLVAVRDQYEMYTTDGNISVHWLFVSVRNCYANGVFGPNRVSTFYAARPDLGEGAGEFAYLKFCVNGAVELRSNYATGQL